MSAREKLGGEAPCSCGKPTILRTQVDLRSCGATVCRVEHAFPEAKYREVLEENERLRAALSVTDKTVQEYQALEKALKGVYRKKVEENERLRAALSVTDKTVQEYQALEKALKGEWTDKLDPTYLIPIFVYAWGFSIVLICLGF